MDENPTTIWDGRERRVQHRQREMLDYLNDRVLEVHREVVALSVQVAQMSLEVDRLKQTHSEEPMRSR